RGRDSILERGPDGSLWLMYLKDRIIATSYGTTGYMNENWRYIYYRFSEDNGVFWSREERMRFPPAEPGGSFYPENFTFRILDSGKWAVAYGSVVSFSEDNGVSWTEPSKFIEPDPKGSPVIHRTYQLLETSDGNLWVLAKVSDMVDPDVHCYSGNPRCIDDVGGYSVSKDGGITWSDFRPVTPYESVWGLNRTLQLGGSYLAFDYLDAEINQFGQIAVVAGGVDERSLWFKQDDDYTFLAKADMRRFSPYVGKNELPRVGALEDGKFGIIWKSGTAKQGDDRFHQAKSIRFGIIDHLEDLQAPPVLGDLYKNSCWGNHNCPSNPIYHSPGNLSYKDKVEFKIKVADHDNIEKVEVLWSLNGVEQSPMKLTDDRIYNKDKDIWDSSESDFYGTRVYGGKYGPFPKGSEILYQVSATDVLGNTAVHPAERKRIKVPRGNPFVREIDLSGIAYESPIREYDNLYWGVSHTASDSTGNLFAVVTVHDRLGNRKVGSILKQFNAEGSLINTYSEEDLNFPENCGPHDVGIDGQDNIYVTSNCVEYINKFTNGGDFIESIEWDGANAWLGCEFTGQAALIEIDKKTGAIYITRDHTHYPGLGSSSGDGLMKLDANGKCDEDASNKLKSFQKSVVSIAVDDSGNIYVSHDGAFWEDGENNIHKYAPDGTLLAEWGPVGDKNEEFSSVAMWYAAGNVISLGVSNDGFLYAASASTGEIKKFTLDGKFVSKWEGKTPDKSIPKDGYFSETGNYSGLGSISIDSLTGNIYVTDSCNKFQCRNAKKRVQVFSPF
ncbi:MAG: hypothetical protein VYC23_02665, partial [Chloroflexota bacterium]|nr:hypothetical protein [Chloroflexota bacterium]